MILLIENIYIDSEIITHPFLCDTDVCLGACCTFYGEVGAPLQLEEEPQLFEVLPLTLPHLSKTSKDWINKYGISENVYDYPTTNCINKKDCVFVYYESNSKIALCSIEKCFFSGQTTFRKPLSCWLYPIRVTEREGKKYLYYSKIKECSSAISHGRRENIYIYQALREPLEKLLGKEWYGKLLEAVDKWIEKDNE